MWLHATAGGLRIDGYRVGAVDFEHAGSWGDPAADLGTLLGDCIAHARPGTDLGALPAAYREVARGTEDPGFAGRVAGWAAERLRHSGSADERLVARGAALAHICRQTPGDWTALLDEAMGGR